MLSVTIAAPDRRLLVIAALVLATLAGLLVASPSLAQAAADQRIEVPEPSAEAMRYYRTGVGWWWVRTIWSFTVPALLLLTGLSARLRDWATRSGRRWFFALSLFIIGYSLWEFVLSLPLRYFGGFLRQHAYDLSNQAFSKWLSDSLKGLMLSIGGSVLFLWIPFLLVRRSPRRWWLYTGLALIPFVVVGLLVAPVWIDPLFNDFGAMKDPSLEQAILTTAERAGIEGGRVFEVNKSIDTNAVNAYVTGIGQTKRIVLWDTIIAKLDHNELIFVMGHEMGHYVLGHVARSIAFYAVLILACLYLMHRLGGGIVRRFGRRFGVVELHDFAVLPLALILLNLGIFLASPIALAVSRHQEHEADRFALELLRNNHAGASAFAKLQQQNLGNPRPGFLYKIWRASHPPLGERIDFCNEYRPWQTGAPRRYEHLFER